MDLLGVTEMSVEWTCKSPLEKWNWGVWPQKPLAWRYPFRISLFLISMIITWCPLQNFLHKPQATEWSAQKCFQSGHALANACPEDDRLFFS